MIILRLKDCGFVVEQNLIKALRKLNYPEFYVNYLEKINPLILLFIDEESLDNIDLIETGFVVARPMDYDSWGTMASSPFPGNDDSGPYLESKGGKTYVSLFFNIDDPDNSSAEEYGWSDLDVVLWYCLEDKKWYTRNGLFIKTYKEIPDPKSYIIEKINSIVFDDTKWNSDVSWKLENEIKRL